MHRTDRSKSLRGRPAAQAYVSQEHIVAHELHWRVRHRVPSCRVRHLLLARRHLDRSLNERPASTPPTTS